MARNSLKNVMKLIDNAKQTVLPEDGFLNDLKRSIEMTDEKYARKPSQTYKPSSMNCIRQSFYQIVGTDPDPANSSYISVGICNSGSDIHVRIQTAILDMKENGMDCEYVPVDEFVRLRGLKDINIVGVSGMETKLYHKKFNMSFMCDGIIKYKNHYYILELKTENSNKFFNRNSVDYNHYHQATAYSLAFGLDEVLFVYISRDTLDMKSFMLNVTPAMKEELVGYIEECDSYVKRLIAPPKPSDISKKACSYCGYKEQCKKDN